MRKLTCGYISVFKIILCLVGKTLKRNIALQKNTLMYNYSNFVTTLWLNRLNTIIIIFLLVQQHPLFPGGLLGLLAWCAVPPTGCCGPSLIPLA